MNIFNKKTNYLHSQKKLSKTLKKYTVFSILIIMIIYSTFKFIENSKTSYLGVSPTSFEEDTFTICIDAGHGDWDLGASGDFTDEKDITLDVSLKLGALLDKSDNINVVYTRTNDIISASTATESLYERVEFSNNENTDLFISIHCNSYPDDISVDGIETWYDPTDDNSRYYASLIQEELVDLNFTSDRGILTYEENDGLYVIENTNATAVLVELGFITNPYDEEFLASSSGKKQCAKALYNATITYISSLEEQESKSS